MPRPSRQETPAEISATLSQEIMRLMTRGACNDRIFDFIAWDNPTAYESEDQRQRAAAQHEKWKGKYVPFDPEERARLYNLINVLRAQYKRERKRRVAMDAAIGSDLIVTLDQVEEVPTRRFTGGFHEIDRVFGSTRFYDANYTVTDEVFGIPRGKAMLIAGEPGVGKTKFYTAEAITLAEDFDRRILIFQKEMTPGEYKEIVMNMYRSMGREPTRLHNIVCRRDRNYQEQVRVIREVRPDLVVDDSYNLTHGADTKHGIEDIVFYWKDAMGDHSAAWMIAHLNERGGIKGNNHIRYLVDSTFTLKWAETPENDLDECQPQRCKDRVKLTSGKNRQGPKGVFAYLRHVNDHMDVLPLDPDKAKTEEPEPEFAEDEE